jgi:uncharacterized protein with HEPN domain
VHDYLGIRIERIVPIIQQDVPALKSKIFEILSQLDSTSDSESSE